MEDLNSFAEMPVKDMRRTLSVVGEAIGTGFLIGEGETKEGEGERVMVRLPTLEEVKQVESELIAMRNMGRQRKCVCS
jgi:hypothetical protein